ncbi:MAG TPA: hypothetical protein VJV78_34245 [Polyangiales bacterium]|nr:hypothetical protein [Polyangiales bacterium]
MLAAIDGDGAFDGQLVQRALSRMSGVLKVHVAMEIEALYPRLLEHEDAEVRRLAQSVIEKLKSTYDGFFQFRSTWNAEAVEADRQTFVAQARFVAKAFHDSTHQEELRLYDKVDAIFAAMRGQ